MIRHKLTELFCQVYYEEMYPLSSDPTAEECNNRKEKAIDEYMGKSSDPLKVTYPILHCKVDHAVSVFMHELKQFFLTER